MMFGGQRNVFSAGLSDHIGPMIGIKKLGAKLRSKILIRKRRAVDPVVKSPGTGINRLGVGLLPFGDGMPLPFCIRQVIRQHGSVSRD